MTKGGVLFLPDCELVIPTFKSPLTRWYCSLVHKGLRVQTICYDNATQQPCMRFLCFCRADGLGIPDGWMARWPVWLQLCMVRRLPTRFCRLKSWKFCWLSAADQSAGNKLWTASEISPQNMIACIVAAISAGFNLSVSNSLRKRPTLS